MKQCKLCKQTVSQGQSHRCPNRGDSQFTYDDDDFLTSFVVAAATDSALVGVAAGGDIAGALLGDALDGDIFDD